MKQIQLVLFPEPIHEVPKIRYYKDLSIHEKINVKSNIGRPFAHNYLLSARRGYNMISPIKYNDHPEQMQQKQFRWDMDKNAGSENRINTYLKGKLNLMKTIK